MTRPELLLSLLPNGTWLAACRCGWAAETSSLSREGAHYVWAVHVRGSHP